MLSFAEAADRLVRDGIAQSMTAEGLRRLARDPQSGWPIGPNDYRVVGKTRMLPYELLAPYIQARKPGRGPAKEPRKKRRPQQQGDPVSTTVDPRIAVLSDLSSPSWHPVPEAYGMPWDDAVKLLDAYRAAVVAEVVEALTVKAQELSTEAEAEMRRDLEERAQVWHEAATVAAKLKRVP
ncbi:hypothetical protein [Streptomyces sp. Ag109_O5-1]|uniref:hypothetical protein n=1 Tax=Streptomyces sp. Ag109_O5-1 TaxID=1938851 RepID=UPI000F4DC74C|nr:hypothetical protein [Streptomyces sp. Ag109_O5-1]